MKKLLFGLATVFACAAAILTPVSGAVAHAEEAPRDTVVLDSCDLGSGWNAVPDSLNKRVGMASLMKKQRNVWYEATFFDIDTSDLSRDEAYLEFWFYIQNPAIFEGDGQIELTSVGKQDDGNEIHWAASSVSWQAGWNYASLKFSDGVVSGTFDFENINFFRFYQFTSEVAEVWIDHLIVTTAPKTPDPALLGVPAGGIVRPEEERADLTDEEKEALNQAFVEKVIDANSTKGDNGGYYALLGVSCGLAAGAAALFAAAAAIRFLGKKKPDQMQ